MADARLGATAERITAARRRGARITLAAAQTPAGYEEGFAIQDLVVATLASPTIGWKVMRVPEGPVIFAPLLQSGCIEPGGTWTPAGGEPAGIELEIGFRMGRDVPAGATPEVITDAVAAAHVVFELCQSRIAEPGTQPRHVMLADCIANAGVVLGPEIPGWRGMTLAGRTGRLEIDGKPHAEGRGADPIGALQLLPPALTGRGKQLKTGEIVITGSLIGMNWLTGPHALKGSIEGCGEVAIRLERDRS